MKDVITNCALVVASLDPVSVKNPLALDTGCRKQPSHALRKVNAFPCIRRNGFRKFKIFKTKFEGSWRKQGILGSLGRFHNGGIGITRFNSRRIFSLLTKPWNTVKEKVAPRRVEECRTWHGTAGRLPAMPELQAPWNFFKELSV
eukprot:s11_g52.t1